MDEAAGEEQLSVVEGVALPVEEAEVALPVEEAEVATKERVRLLPGDQLFFPFVTNMVVPMVLDPTRRDCYLVLNSAGLFQVELPWIFRMDSVAEGDT